MIEVRVFVQLTCDGDHRDGHATNLPTTWTGEGIAYTEQRDAAKKAGWSIALGKVLCPACAQAWKKPDTIARAGT